MPARKSFLNFQVDHMTLLLRRELYPVAYLIFRNVFGTGKDGILYEKRRPADAAQKETSMTFAVNIGSGTVGGEAFNNTIIAVVQPSEPSTQRSHVREMLDSHAAAAHWQHIALRTPDLLAFHAHALARGVNFITPILVDESEDLIQTFSGEWYFPGSRPSALFFEFVQRDPSPDHLRLLEEHNREAWFRDKTFLGLYNEKEREYQSGAVTPFIDPELFERLRALVGDRQVFEIGEETVARADAMMLEYGQARRVRQAA